MKVRFNWTLVLTCIVMVCAMQIATAQTINVAGTVFDPEGEPIIGATVMIKGTDKGVSTDIDGKFSFKAVDPKAHLVISYVGMKKQDVPVKPQMTIHMEEENAVLDEVIVTAFGTAKKSSFTGSATVLSSDKIEKKQVTDLMQSLQGEVPGLTLSPATSPGGTSSIVIRGKGSINASTDPLIILDGVPYDGSMNSINSQDVENITVLKDAASAALYGARGANGVILITTKSGKSGNAKVTLDAKWGANTRATEDYDRITNPGQYYEMYYKALYNSYIGSGMTPSEAHVKANANLCGKPSNGGLGYQVYSVPTGEYLIGSNGRLNPNATLGNRIYHNGAIYTLLPDDWTKETYRTGFRQEYNAAISGGNDSGQVYASIGYQSNEGIVKASDFDRFTGRLRAAYQIKKWLNFGANVGYTHSVNNYAYNLGADSDTYSTQSVFSDAANIGPIYPLYVRDASGRIMHDSHGIVYDWGDGSYNTDGSTRPPLINYNSLNCLDLEYYESTANNTTADAYADVLLPLGFKATIKGGTTVFERRIKSAVNPYYGFSAQTGGSLTVGHYRTTSVNFQQLLNWTHNFGDNNVQIMLGHENYDYKYEALYANKTNAVDYDNVHELNGFLSSPGDPSSYCNDYNTEGYMARVMWDLKDRYYGQASFRRDASSRFHPDHRWGNFWSLGGAWIISKESWFHADETWLNNLKIKASYGEVGNDRIGSYRYVDTYTITNTDGELSLALSAKGNKDISWETISNLNAGVEFDLFNYRLSGSLEVYNKLSHDMLLWFSVPSSLGYSGYYKNIGDMYNRGIEVTLNATPVRTRDLNWSVNLNFNYNVQKVSYLPDSNKSMTVEGHGGYQSGNDYFIGEGLSLNTFFVAHYAGISDDGQQQWYIKKADGSVGTTTSYSDLQTSDLHLVDGNQRMRGGFGTTFQWKGFDVMAHFAFGLGGKVHDAEYAQLMTSPISGSTGYAIHKDLLKAWTPENKNTSIPRWQYGDQYTGIISDRYLIDGSYLSFQNAQVGYTLPKSVTRALSLGKARFYVTADNIYLWSKRKGLDPRLAGGYGGYSVMRTISGGVNIEF